MKEGRRMCLWKKEKVTKEKQNKCETKDDQPIAIIEEKKAFPIENTDQVLTLLGLYLSDWEHRDSIFWKQIYSYFTASLVVMMLPFIDMWGLRLPEALPKWLFPIIGIILSIIFCIVWNGYLARLKPLSDAYQELLDMLPECVRRKRVDEIAKTSKLMSMRMAALICWTMFIALIAIGLLLLYFTITPEIMPNISR